MTFSSLIFFFGFLPIILVLYHVIPTGFMKNILLILASFLFYAWDSPIYLVLLVLSILWNYSAGINLSKVSDKKKRKRLFWLSVAVNLLILAFFKYANFIVSILNSFSLSLQPFSFHLPIGLSFFTFSAISYLADVYMEKVPVQKNLMKLALYISFFGKVNMGPIVQYNQMEDQLQKRDCTFEDFKEGIFLFFKGLFKKVLLADRLALLFAGLKHNGTVLGTWLFAISYMLQIYFDFSGYSDMAIGLSRLFGFHFKPNFNHPYCAISVQDFWRRWHISLSQWFRDYIYIPLGGNRVSTKLYIRNIFVVWFLTGLWHGANWTFIVWGVYYGCFLLLEKFVLNKVFEKCPTWIRRVYTLLVVLIAWVFFMSPSISKALQTIACMFGVGAKGLINTEVFFYLKNYFLCIVFACILSGNTYKYFQRANFVCFKNKAHLVMSIVYIVLFFISVSFIVSSTFQTFLYFAF